MPFQIIRNDITKVSADAIVNTANPHPRIGSGTDSAIYKAAGEKELLAERLKIGDIPVGKAAVTSAFAIDAKYIIHTVGPAWKDGNHGEEAALRSCYEECLKLASELGCESIAFPLISTGVYGFPKDLALRTATSAIYDFLLDNDMMVYLVVFGRKAYDLSGKLFQDIQTYIDDHYVSEQESAEYGYNDGVSMSLADERRMIQARRRMAQNMPLQSESSFAGNIEDHLHTDSTFQEYLLQLIIERDMKNSEVYNGANITKQHFSKIMSNKDYNPTKNTVCALALSLRLDLDGTNALLEKAGMILSHSSRFDLAVEYFVINKMHNVVIDNIMLEENGLPQLGTR